MKILVDELPETPKECPFAIHCSWDDGAYPVCKLKYRGTYEYISFSFVPNKISCSLSEGKECEHLKKVLT